MRCVLVVMLMAVLPTATHAQERTIAGFSGATFAANPSALVGGEASLRVVPQVEVVGELVYLGDIVTEDALRDMERLAEAFEAFSRIALGQQVDVELEAKAPGFHGAVGIRLLLPAARAFELFLQGDIGFTRIDPKMRFFDNGQDISNSVGPPIGRAETKPSLGFGGGVRIPISEQLLALVRYHFIRVFAEEAFAPLVSGGYNVNRLAFGLGYRF